MYFSLEWNFCHFNRAMEELVSSSPCTWALFKYLCSFVSFFFLLLSVNKTFMDVQVSLGGRWNAAALDLNHRTSSSFVVFLGSESWQGRSEMAQRVMVLFPQNERNPVKSRVQEHGLEPVTFLLWGNSCELLFHCTIPWTSPNIWHIFELFCRPSPKKSILKKQQDAECDPIENSVRWSSVCLWRKG